MRALIQPIGERTIAGGAGLCGSTSHRRTLEQVFLDIVGVENSGQ